MLVGVVGHVHPSALPPMFRNSRKRRKLYKVVYLMSLNEHDCKMEISFKILMSKIDDGKTAVIHEFKESVVLLMLMNTSYFVMSLLI